MSSRNFGNYLKNLRIERNMTREDLANGICSVRQLQRIESNENDPSLFLLNGFGMKLNINLPEIYTQDFIINNDECYKITLNIDKLITASSLKKLRDYISSLDVRKYKDNSFFVQMYEYAHALCALKLDHDLVATSYHITRGLELEFPLDKRNRTGDYRFSNTGYTLLNLQASVLFQQGHYQEAVHLCIEIKRSVEQFFFARENASYLSATFINRIYQAILLKLVKNHIQLQQYDIAEDYLRQAFDFSNEKQVLECLPDLFKYQAKFLASKDNYSEANECIITAKRLLYLKGQTAAAEKLQLYK